MQPVAPAALLAFQERFACALTTSLELGAEPGIFRTRTEDYPAAIVDRVLAGKSSGRERLGIYNRQYWFRLFTVLQEELPLLLRLLGVHDFHRMATEYLRAHPSRSRYLRDLCSELPAFLGQSEAWSEAILLQCAELELCYIHAFDAEELPRLDLESLGSNSRETLLTRPLRFQASFHLIEEDWELVETRLRVKAQLEDETMEAPPYPGAKKGHWAIFRDSEGCQALRLSPLQHHLLTLLRQGLPVADACERLAAELLPEDLRHLTDSLQSWFGSWAALSFFAAPNPSE